MSSATGPWFRRLREPALNAGAVAGALCLVAVAASMLLGITPLIFRSGSMAPTIGTGALALARTVPAEQLEVGDIVSLEDPTGVRLTHRVVDVDPGGNNTAVLRLKGDANTAPDPQPYVVAHADRVFFHIDGLGYVVAWLSNPVAVFLGGMVAGGLLVIAFGRTREPATHRSGQMAGHSERTDHG